MLTPAQFGLPPKFRDWRPGQLDAVNQIIDPTGPRFQIVCAPTGFGKSLMYMAAAKLSGNRTAVLTSTKGLQDQLSSDFTEMGMVDIRGQSNYQCTAAAEFGLPGYVTVEGGPCKSGAACVLKSNGCEYFDRRAAARIADLVSTNYAAWMYDILKGGDENSRDGKLDGKRAMDMLILDEAHDAPDQLSGFLGEELKRDDLTKAGVEWPDGLGEGKEEWIPWAAVVSAELVEKIDSRMGASRKGNLTPDELRRVAAWKRALRKLEKIAGMRGEWIIEKKENWEQHNVGTGLGGKKQPLVQFDPLWPKLYAENVLFRNVKKIVLVSATVRPKTANVLGIAPSEVEFREYGSSFPIRSRPVIHIPTVQMNHRINDFGLMVWLGMIDRILDERADKKGVIHTVSYSRAQLIQSNSRHVSRMLLHDSKNRQAIVEQFKTSRSNSILVSPSVDTGYDFPHTECEFQIISKIPFPDNRGKVIKARMKTDPEYSNYMTAQVLVQMTGRGMRAEDDKCETIIVDDNARWFVSNNRKFFPKWWLEAYRSVNELGEVVPLEKL